MEKPCTTTYALIGNRQDVKFLYGKLLKMVYGHKTTMKQLAKTFCPQWADYDIIGQFSELELVNERFIKVTVLTPSMPEPEIWFHICRQYHTVNCWYFAEEPANKQYRTNDAVGTYFPQRYVVEALGITRAIVSQQDLYAEVAKHVPVGESFTTLERLGNIISKHLSRINVFDIIVVDKHGKCITPKKTLISQFIKIYKT